MSRRKVKFQTSLDESDESEAMRIFLQFERGESGHLNLKQFKQAVAELDLTNKSKVRIVTNLQYGVNGVYIECRFFPIFPEFGKIIIFTFFIFTHDLLS